MVPCKIDGVPSYMFVVYIYGVIGLVLLCVSMGRSSSMFPMLQ